MSEEKDITFIRLVGANHTVMGNEILSEYDDRDSNALIMLEDGKHVWLNAINERAFDEIIEEMIRMSDNYTLGHENTVLTK